MREGKITMPDINGWEYAGASGQSAVRGEWTGGPSDDPEQYTLRVYARNYYDNDGKPRFSASIEDSRISGMGGVYYPLASGHAQHGVKRMSDTSRYRHTDRAEFYVDLFAWMTRNPAAEFENPLYDERIHTPPEWWYLRRHRMTERLDEWEWLFHGKQPPDFDRAPGMKIMVEGHRGGASYGIDAYVLASRNPRVFERIPEEELPTTIPEDMNRERAILRAQNLAEALPDHRKQLRSAVLDDEDDDTDTRTDGGIVEWRRLREQVNQRVRDMNLGPDALPDRDEDEDEERDG